MASLLLRQVPHCACVHANALGFLLVSTMASHKTYEQRVAMTVVCSLSMTGIRTGYVSILLLA